LPPYAKAQAQVMASMSSPPSFSVSSKNDIGVFQYIDHDGGFALSWAFFLFLSFFKAWGWILQFKVQLLFGYL
jgi:hypothetical protein